MQLYDREGHHKQAIIQACTVNVAMNNTGESNGKPITIGIADRGFKLKVCSLPTARRKAVLSKGWGQGKK